MRLRSLLGPVVVLALLPGCSAATGDPPQDNESTGRAAERVNQVSSAYCSISVTGHGSVDMELDYLPHVIACENNGAGLEALKAQAIAARSVAYYNMATQGSICDGQGCQVYSCNNQPGPLHYQAVAETAQMYLSYGQMLTYGFYVAGDSGVSGPSCVDSGGSTTKWVTFNDGKSGSSVKQTKLGYVGPPGFGQNRGCMSQYGARCLEQNGRDFVGILRFYYGSDINVITAPGNCPSPQVNPTEPTEPTPTPEPTPEPTPSPSPSSASCQGICGSPNAAPGSSPSCYCDDQCTGYRDCCGDYQAACGGSSTPEPTPAPTPTPAPSGSGSCVGMCFASGPAPGSSPACYCDASCLGFGDCCADFGTACF